MKVTRGYSDFFTSGFRAVTTRHRRTATPSPPVSRSDAIVFPIQPTPTKKTRLRPASMFIAPTKYVAESSSSSSKKSRRSSVISFSSKLLQRVRPTSMISSVDSTSRRGSIATSRTEASVISEVWITAGGPFTLSAHPAPDSDDKDSIYYQPIDPFSPSPDSKSFFIDLTDSPPLSPPKRESFLSLSTPSPDRLSAYFPPRRERPTSVQSMPLPVTHSRRSSYQYHPPTLDRYESWSILEEESPLASPLAMDLAEDWEDPAQLDWRQFHMELLGDEA